jgi:hypothetical protein
VRVKPGRRTARFSIQTGRQHVRANIEAQRARIHRCDVNRCLTKCASVQAAVTVAAVAPARSTQFGVSRYLD